MKQILLVAALCLCLFACKKNNPEPESNTPASIVGNWRMITHQASVYDNSNKFLGLEDLYLENISFTADGKLIETDILGNIYTSKYAVKEQGGKNYLFLSATDGAYTDQYEITQLDAKQLDFTTGSRFVSEPFSYRDGTLAKISVRIIATR